jgi:hypothetical protein
MMTSDSPDSMVAAVPPDRRPAIWPWIVMPLIALTAYYYLHRLNREANEQADLAPPPRAALIHSEAGDQAAEPPPSR